MAARLRILSSHVTAAVDYALPPSQEDVEAASRGLDGYQDTLARNWSGTVYFAGTPLVPASLAELQAVVRDCTPPLRVVGRAHSFTPLVECSGGTLISLGRLNRVLSFEAPSEQRLGSITVEGGITYTEVVNFLGKRGALSNMASWPSFSVAGATATGTHGSGLQNYSLHKYVSAIEFVKADGTLATFSRKHSPDLLEGTAVHLGCLGVVSRLTLDVVPYYEVCVFAYADVSTKQFIDALPDLVERCDSLSAFCDFSKDSNDPSGGRCSVSLRNFVPHRNEVAALQVPDWPQELLGGRQIKAQWPSDESGGVAWTHYLDTCKGPYYCTITNAGDDGTEIPMPNPNVQAEFFVPFVVAPAAIRAAWDAIGQDARYLHHQEMRIVKGDGAWLSATPVDSLAIHFGFHSRHREGKLITERRLARITQVLDRIEKALQPFGARPHWGKLAPLTFTQERMMELYGEKLTRFRELCNSHDKNGKFRNVFLHKLLFE